MRVKVNRKQNAAFKATSVSNGNCYMGSVPIGGQPSVPSLDHDGQKSLISDKIEQVSKASDNLCLPNCMFQALRSEALRKAFSAGNRKEVFKAFVELSAGQRNIQTGKVINRETNGYFPNDMTRYLNFLQTNIWIKDYLFLRIQAPDVPKIFIRLFTEPHFLEEKTLVFFGHSMPSDEKQRMAKRFEDLHKSLSSNEYSHLSGDEQRIAVELDMIKFYNNPNEMVTLRKRFNIPKNEHGISIGIEKDKSMWLYDNGNKVRKPVTSIAHVAPYLLSYKKVYVFKLSVW